MQFHDALENGSGKDKYVNRFQKYFSLPISEPDDTKKLHIVLANGGYIIIGLAIVLAFFFAIAIGGIEEHNNRIIARDSSWTGSYVQEKFDEGIVNSVSSFASEVASGSGEGLVVANPDGDMSKEELDNEWNKRNICYPVSGSASKSRGSVEIVDSTQVQVLPPSTSPDAPNTSSETEPSVGGSERDDVQQQKETEESLIPTGALLHVKYMMADDSDERMHDITINELMGDNELLNHFIGVQEGESEIFVVRDEPSVCMSYVDPSKANGIGGKVVDASAALCDTNGQAVDGMVLDRESGILYFPSSVLDDTQGLRLQVALLQTISLESEDATYAEIPVSTFASADSSARGLVMPVQTVRADAFDHFVDVPLFPADCEDMPDEISVKNLQIWINGVPVEVNDDTAEYDADSGHLVLGFAPSGIASISVLVSQGTGNDALGGLLDALLLPEQAGGAVLSDGNMSFFHNGNAFFDMLSPSSLRAGQVFDFQTEMCSHSCTTESSKYGYATGIADAAADRLATQIAYGASWDAIRNSTEPWRTLYKARASVMEFNGPFSQTIDGVNFHMSTKPGVTIDALTGGCTHITSPLGNHHHDANVWFNGPIRMRVLRVVDNGNWSYAIMGFVTPNVHGAPNQAVSGIYKIRIAESARATVTKSAAGSDVFKIASGKRIAGAAFGIYLDDECTQLEETRFTGADGTFSFTGFPGSVRYVREMSAPWPYSIDDSVHKVIFGDYGTTKYVNVSDSSFGTVKISKLKRPQKSTYSTVESSFPSNDSLSKLQMKATVSGSANDEVSYELSISAREDGNISFQIPVQISYCNDADISLSGAASENLPEASRDDEIARNVLPIVEVRNNEINVDGLKSGADYVLRFSGKISQGWSASSRFATLLIGNAGGEPAAKSALIADLPANSMAGAQYTIYADRACSIPVGTYVLQNGDYKLGNPKQSAASLSGAVNEAVRVVEGGSHAQWRAIPAGDGLVSLVDTKTGLVFSTTKDESDAPICAVIAREGDAKQQFAFEPADDGSFYMHSLGSIFDIRYGMNNILTLWSKGTANPVDYPFFQWDLVPQGAGATMTLDSTGSAAYGFSSGQALVSGKTYYIKETKAPDGYDIDDEVHCFVADSSKTPQINLTDSFTSIEIQKQTKYPEFSDNDSRYSIEGAVYGLYLGNPDSGGSLVRELTTDAAGRARADGVLKNGDYWVKEISPSNGLMLDTEAHKVDMEAGALNVVELKEDIPVKIAITKKSTKPVPNIEAYSLAGAKFALYGSQEDAAARENQIAETVSDESGTCPVLDLPMQDYYVREVEPPYGYYLDDEIYEIPATDFMISTTQERTYRNEPRPPQIQVKKSADPMTVMEGYYSSLAGCEFSVYATHEDAVNKSNAIKSVTSLQDGTVPVLSDLPLSDKLFLRETKAADAYEIDETIYMVDFSRNLTFHQEIEDIGKPVSISIRKSSTDEQVLTSNYSLEGAAFGIYKTREDAMNRENAVATTYTDENGVCKEVTGLHAQAYWISEIAAPRGFYIAPEPICAHFDEGSRAEISFENDPIRGIVEVAKRSTDEFSTPDTDAETFSYEGAIFGVYDAFDKAQAATAENPGDPICNITSDASGIARTQIPVVPGTYFVKEMSAPKGYLVNDSVYTVETKIGEEPGTTIEPDIRSNRIVKSSNRVIVIAPDTSSLDVLDNLSDASGFGLMGYEALSAAEIRAIEHQQIPSSHVDIDYDIDANGKILDGTSNVDASTHTMVRGRTPFDLMAVADVSGCEGSVAVVGSGVDTARVPSTRIAKSISLSPGEYASSDVHETSTLVMRSIMDADSNCKFLSIKVSDADGQTSMSGIVAGMKLALDANASEIHIPLLRSEYDRSFSATSLESLISVAAGRGVEVKFIEDEPVSFEAQADASSSLAAEGTDNAGSDMFAAFSSFADGVGSKLSELLSPVASFFLADNSPAQAHEPAAVSDYEKTEIDDEDPTLYEMAPPIESEILPPTTYTLHFEANGGNGSVDDVLVTIDRSSENPAETVLPDGSGLSRDGYEFYGWVTRPVTDIKNKPLVLTPGQVLSNLEFDGTSLDDGWVDGRASIAAFCDENLTIFLDAVWENSETGNLEPDYSKTIKNGMMRTSSTSYSALYRARRSGNTAYLYTGGNVPDGYGWRTHLGYVPNSSSTPVYELYNPWGNNGGKDSYHYTPSRTEYNNCVNTGWTGKGIKFYSDDAGGIAVNHYDCTSNNSNFHFFDTSYCPSGYTNRGAAFYMLAFYNVAFNGNGATGGSTAAQNTRQYGIGYYLPGNGFTKTGYHFYRWYGSNGGYYNNGSWYSNLARSGTITMYAQWLPNTYSIAFDGNGANSGSVGSLGATYDKGVTLPKNGFVKKGHKMSSWNTKPDGTGTRYNLGANASNLTAVNGGNVTLYAQWEEVHYTIKYDANGGEGTMQDSSPQLDFDFVLPPNEYTKNNCTFIGWSRTKPYGNIRVARAEFADGATINNLISSDGDSVTLYAVWKASIDNPDCTVIKDMPIVPSVKIEKHAVDVDPKHVYQDERFSLEGAVFGIYPTRSEAEAANAEEVGNPIETVVTDAYGNAYSKETYIPGESYFIKELSAPTSESYELNSEVLPTGTMPSTGPATVVVDESPSMPMPELDDDCMLVIKKRISVNGEATYSTESGEWSVEGTQFGVYKTQEDAIADSNAYRTVSIGSDGTAMVQLDAMLLGDEVWVKERFAADGLSVGNMAPVKVMNPKDKSTLEIEFENDVSTVGIEIEKVSSSPDAENQVVNGNYSLEGASFGIYGTAEDAQERKNAIVELVSDENGHCEASGLYPRTYYVREHAAPMGYAVSDRVYEIHPSIGQKETVRIADNPVMATLSVEKNSDAGLSTFDSVFGIYSDEHCLDELAQLQTSANGRSGTISLMPGTYYVKELKAPAFHEISSETRKVELEASKHISISFTDHAPMGTISIAKSSNHPDWLENDLSGAIFGIFSDKECSTQVDKLVTESDGTAHSEKLCAGTYWIKEIKPLVGHAASDKVFETEVLDGKVSAVNSGEPIANVSGALQLHKICPDDGSADGLSLAGAVYGVYSSPLCSGTSKIASLTTQENGWSDILNLIVPGTYYVREEIAPEGWSLDTEVHEVEITGDVVTIVQSQELPASSKVPITLYKRNAETASSEQQGDISVLDAEFEVRYYRQNARSEQGISSIENPERMWKLATNVDGVADLLPENLLEGSDELFLDDDGNVIIPDGCLLIDEIKAPDGLLVGEEGVNRRGDASHRFYYSHDGALFGNDGRMFVDELPVIVYDSPIRGNVKVKKTDGDGKALPGIPFALSLLGADGNAIETHLVMTDSNGEIDTSALLNTVGTPNRNDYLLLLEPIETSNTSNGALEGGEEPSEQDGLLASVPQAEGYEPCPIWFSGINVSPDAVDASRGALLYGKYRLVEASCPENDAYSLADPIEFDISENNESIDLGTVVNTKPKVEWTDAKCKTTGTKYASSLNGTFIEDIVRYEDLLPGTEYSLGGIVCDTDTQDAVQLPDMTFLTTTLTFTPTEPEGELVMRYDTEGFDMRGKTVSILLNLDSEYKTKNVHNEALTDLAETLYFPAIATRAKDATTNSSMGAITADGRVRIVDTVEYANLEPGKAYTLIGTLNKKDVDGTAIEITGRNGRALQASSTFVPATSDGTTEVAFDISAEDVQGISEIVVFEVLRNADGIDVAEHRDIDDEEQTVSYPALTTRAGGRDSNVLGEDNAPKDVGHDVPANRASILYDEVNYSNLELGKSYRAKGWFVDRESGDVIKGSDGTEICASMDFECSSATSGKLIMEFPISRLNHLVGHHVTAYEEIYEVNPDGTETLVAFHKDVASDSQTVAMITPTDTVNMPGSGMFGMAMITAIAAMLLIIAGTGFLWQDKRHRKSARE